MSKKSEKTSEETNSNQFEMDEKFVYSQIFDMMNFGLLIIDSEFVVHRWNRWMEMHSEIPAEDIVEKNIFDYFPNLKTPNFLRNIKSTFSFGNFCFFSQKLHQYLFPFKPDVTAGKKVKFMQQSCSVGPIRDSVGSVKYVFISVQDVTEVVNYENKLLELSILDGLTSVFNRRYLEQRLVEEFTRHKRYSSPLSCIMLDVDFFKKVNDQYGHAAGDYVLIEIAKHFKKSLRTSDVLARYGGEEFAILLSDTSLADAAKVAERYRKEIEEKDFVFKGKKIHITVSLGVNEANELVDSPADFIRKADKNLYLAKEKGRNCVVVDSVV